eukprot:6212249-Pleurochrysis_carterae.AAC.2
MESFRCNCNAAIATLHRESPTPDRSRYELQPLQAVCRRLRQPCHKEVRHASAHEQQVKPERAGKH